MAALRFGVVRESVATAGSGWISPAGSRTAGSARCCCGPSRRARGQQLAPFSALAAAAAVTTRLRVGTLVLSNDFRHPAIVAHEAASLHLLRRPVRARLGAGRYRAGVPAAGIAFDTAGRRIARRTNRSPSSRPAGRDAGPARASSTRSTGGSRRPPDAQVRCAAAVGAGGPRCAARRQARGHRRVLPAPIGTGDGDVPGTGAAASTRRSACCGRRPAPVGPGDQRVARHRHGQAAGRDRGPDRAAGGRDRRRDGGRCDDLIGSADRSSTRGGGLSMSGGGGDRQRPVTPPAGARHPRAAGAGPAPW